MTLIPPGCYATGVGSKAISLFESLVGGGKTILMVTHDNDLAPRAPRTIVLADGLIVDERIN